MSKKERTRPRDSRPTIGFLSSAFNDESVITLWTGVADAAIAHDVNLIHLTVDPLETPQTSVAYRLLTPDTFDGLVIWGAQLGQYTGPGEVKALCDRLQKPVVNVGIALEGVPSLLMDNYQGMHDVVAHLIDAHGCHRIVFLGGPEASLEAQQRYRGYADALAEQGISLAPHLVIDGDEIMQQFRQMGATRINYQQAGVVVLLDRHNLKPREDFDAIVTYNDAYGFGALDVLRARGVHVPRDVAVAGFDDASMSRYTTPPLTTVRQSFYDLGWRAAEDLLKYLAGTELPEQIVLPMPVVVRQSCGCLAETVARAAVGPQASKARRRAVKSVEAILAARREEILSAMAQASGEDGGGFESVQMEQLLDTFTSEITEEAQGGFLQALDNALRWTAEAGRDMEAWHGALSAMRRGVLPLLKDDEERAQAEDLWHQARLTVSEVQVRVQVGSLEHLTLQTNLVRDLGQTLITTSDTAVQMDMIADTLSRVEARSCYLSLYEDRQAPEAWTRLALAYDAGKRVEPEPAERRFPTPQLMPEGLWPRDRRYHFSFQPFAIGENQFGFMLLEADPGEAAVYDSLSRQISSGLQEALLVQQTEQRTLQMQTAAEVSRAASSILDLDTLIRQVVDLVRERFSLYYAGLFLVDESGEWTGQPRRWAVLRAGTGAAGRQMLAGGHKLEIGGESMIGWCVAHKQARIALDVGEEAVRFDNPFLPETRSELALPLISRGQVIGALTIQSTQEAAFTQEDIAVLQTMADQLANAIANARLYEALSREQSLMNAMMDNIPDHIYFKDEASRFIRASRSQTARFGLSTPAEIVGKTDFDFFTEEHARPAYEDEQEIVRTGEPLVGLQEKETWPDGSATWVETTKMPLRDESGKIVGTFGVSRDITERKMSQEALERRAVQLQAVATVAREAAAIQDVNQIITRAVLLISEEFGFYHTAIYLVDEIREYAILHAASSVGGQQMLTEGHKLRIRDEGIVAYVARRGEPRVVSDVAQDEAYTVNPHLPDTRSEMALPLKIRDRVVGVLDVQSAEKRFFSTEDIATLQTLADQVALAIQNVRLLQESQERLRELEALYGRQVREAWRERTARKPAAYHYTYTGVEPIPAAQTDAAAEPSLLQGNPTTPEPESDLQIVAPLSLHGQTIGAIVLRRPPEEGAWLPEEVALAHEIGNQVSLALENARLLEDTRQRAERERLGADITARVRATIDMDSIMQNVVRELGTALGADRVFIRIGTEDQSPERQGSD